jgi:ABC-type Co2+ transport system permease subunit
MHEGRQPTVIEYIVSKLDAIMQQAVDRYGVNPAIFLAIYLISVPFFYYSLVRMMRALAKKRGNEVLVWSTVFLCATAAPFIYVLFFGRNLPWWVYGIIALLIGQGIFSLIRKLRNTKKANPSVP